MPFRRRFSRRRTFRARRGRAGRSFRRRRVSGMRSRRLRIGYRM